MWVVVLNWNSFDDTAACIESLELLDYQNYQILVVDNASSDGSAARLAEMFPDVPLLQTGQNLGFAGGNNRGIARAVESGAEYVWLVNNDAGVEPGALSELISAMEEAPKVAVAGSKILYWDEPERIWYGGGALNWRTGRSAHLRLHEVDRGGGDPELTGYVTGCSLLVRVSALGAVGLMDERYFLYYEDSDWSTRFQREGFSCLYVPRSVVRHKVSRSLGPRAAAQDYYYTRNNLIFLAKFRPSSVWIAACHLAWDRMARNLARGRWAHARAVMAGYRDFLLGRTGEWKG